MVQNIGQRPFAVNQEGLLMFEEAMNSEIQGKAHEPRQKAAMVVMTHVGQPEVSRGGGNGRS